MDLRKRIIALLLTLTMVLTYMPGLAYAAEGEPASADPVNEVSADDGEEPVSEDPESEESAAAAEESVKLDDQSTENAVPDTVTADEPDNTEEELSSPEDNYADQDKDTEQASEGEEEGLEAGHILKAANEKSTIYDGNGGYYGMCGDNLSWTLSADKVLTISGTGYMYDFAWELAPWNKSMGNIIDESFDAQYKQIIVQDGVQSIGNWAFGGQGKITSIDLPDSVEYIGNNAFNSCTRLTSVHWPKSLYLIEAGAFRNCDLTDVVLPEGVQTIDKEVFMNNSNLSHIKLPSTITRFRGSSLVGTNVKSLGPAGGTYGSGTYDVEIPWGGSLGNIPSEVQFGDADDDFFHPHNAIVPIINVAVPDGITEVKSSFYNMGALEYFSIPESVKVIGSSFMNCDALTEVDLSSCTGIEVFSGTFQDCDRLEKVVLPDQAELQYGVFQNCKKLVEVHLPDSATTLGSDIFHGCTSLKSDSFNWPSRLEDIGSHAFDNCKSLDTIVLPDTLKTIGNCAFRDCINLVKVHIPESVTTCYESFTGCTALISAGPAGDKKYTYNIEYEWKTDIPSSTFSHSELEAVTFPETISRLGAGCLSDCNKLKKVFLPASVKKIGAAAFYGCLELETVRLPAELELVDDNAFADCPKLNKILFRGDAPELRVNIFNNIHITAYYPGSNRTWTSDILFSDKYGDDVTWKPYNPGGPLDPETEHDVTVNHAGTATVRFYLVDKDGNTIPEARFKYVRHGGGHAEEMDNEFIMTDIDGGYDFQSTYLTTGNSTSKENVRFDSFELLSDETQELADTEFTIHATIAPRAYKESWEIRLGDELNVGGVLGISNGNSAKIEVNHKADGKEDLTLSLTLDAGAKATLINRKLLKQDKVTLGEASLGGGEKYLTTYTHVIKNYTKGNSSQRQEVTDFLGLAVLTEIYILQARGKAVKGGVLFESVLENKIRTAYEDIFNEYFDKTSEGGKINVTSSGALASFKNPATGEVLGSSKIFPISGSTDYSFTNSVDPVTKVTSSNTGVKSQFFSAVYSNPITELVGVRGFYGKNKINDVSVGVNSEGTVTLNSCDYDSGFTDAVGWGDIFQYHTITVGGKDTQEYIIDGNDLLTNLTTAHFGMFSTSEYKKILKSIAEYDVASSWKDTEKMTNSYKIAPSISLSPKKDSKADDGGIKLSYKLSLSFAHAWNTEMKNGKILGGRPSITVDSGGAADIMRDAANSSTLDMVLGTPIDDLLGTFNDVIDVVTGKEPASLTIGNATVTADFSLSSGISVSVMKKASGQSALKAAGKAVTQSIPQSFSIIATSKAKNAASGASDDSSDGETEETIKVMTIGDAYHIAAEDADGNEVTDLSSAAPKIVISYTDEELEAASCENSADMIALYHMDEETGIYSYVESTVDTDVMTVTADISQAGQYVLASDAAGVEVTDIRTRNGLTANIGSFSGIKSAEVLLDGQTILTTSGNDTFSQYYDAGTGVFSYTGFKPANGKHVVTFRITNTRGQESVIEHTFTAANAPKISDVSLSESAWYGSEITVKAKVSSAMSDDSDMHVWADVVKKETITSQDTYSDIVLAEAEDQCLMKKEGDYWVGTIRAEKPYKNYEFTVKASDDFGDTSSNMLELTLTVPEDVTINGVTYRIAPETGTITSASIYNSSMIEVTIPDTINGVKVKNIGPRVFGTDSFHVTKVIIPEGVERICGHAFDGCCYLTEAVLPESLKYIDSYAFYGCSDLTEIVLPGSLKSIDSHAFEDCSSLTGIVLPESLETIGSYAFYTCPKLKEVTIPSGVTSIGDYAIGYTRNFVTEKPTPVKDVIVNATPGTEGARYAEQLAKEQHSGGTDPSYDGWIAYADEESIEFTGQPVKLQVVVEGDSSGLTFDWYDYDDNPIKLNGTNTLTVSEEGQYYCEVYDDEDIETVWFDVYSYSESMWEAYAEKERVLYSGSPVRLKVIVSGEYDDISFTWCKASDSEYDFDPIAGAPDSNVYTASEPGTYICEVVDGYDNYQAVVFTVYRESDNPSDGGSSDASKQAEAAKKAAAAKQADLAKTKPGTAATVGGASVRVLTNVSGANNSVPGTVTYTRAPNKKKVTVPPTVVINGKTFKVTQIASKAFTAKKIRRVTIGANVSKIAANAFKSSKATKIILKTKMLKKAGVKKCLKGSKVKTVQVKVGSKKVNKKFVKSYKKIFTKKVAGKKVAVK